MSAFSRHVTSQMAQVAVPKELIRKISRLIDGLRSSRTPAREALPSGEPCRALRVGYEAADSRACVDEGKRPAVKRMIGTISA